ncbi:hypothetical protein BC332_31068 [Capsicum chinense]|nr:hypothetical protein BC332_31068 [Capsicum chinense]
MTLTSEHEGMIILKNMLRWKKVLSILDDKRDKEQWRDLIARLKRIPHNDIIGKLRLTFDGLDKGEKKLFLDFVFLDIACLTRNDFELYMEPVLESRGFQLLRVDYLLEKSLLSIDIHNRIVMHNMLRDMGENDIPEEYVNSRIWLPQEVHDLLKGKFGYSSSSFPESFEPSQHVVLRLYESRLVELWPISKMESLEQLMITNCPKLDKFPEINGDMHCLKEMTLDSIGIRELPSAIENLFGWKLEKLPENIGDLKELETLDARETAISQLPPSITKLVKLGELSFSRVVQHVQHSSIFVFHQLSALSYLNELHLNNLNILGGLPETLGSLQSLEHLDVSGSNISVKMLLNFQESYHQI